MEEALEEKKLVEAGARQPPYRMLTKLQRMELNEDSLQAKG